MSEVLEKLVEAQKQAMTNRPRVGGFPYLAECLRRAGVIRNIWTLPACQSLFVLKGASIVQQGAPLVTGSVDVPKFNQEALVRALRTDQAGESTFPEFLLATWNAGVIRYEVDFMNRTVSYSGSAGEVYAEEYPLVVVQQ